jgi:hypothetical protein
LEGERDFATRVVVPILDATLPALNADCKLRTLETASKSSSLRRRVGHKIDYIASSSRSGTNNINIEAEIFFAEIAGGISGAGEKKSGNDEKKIHIGMKDSLDMYKRLLMPTDDEWKEYCVYGLTINGLCTIFFYYFSSIQKKN